MIKEFFLSLILGFGLGLAAIFVAHNIYQYQKSFDQCEQLVHEIHQNLQTLKDEIVFLQDSMQEIIYE